MVEEERRQKIAKTLVMAFNVKNMKKLVRILLPFGVGLILGAILTYVPIQYIKLFPTPIDTSLAIEILKVLIEVNGILIGLNGLVFAQMLSGIHSEKNLILRQQYEGRLDPSKITTPMLEELASRRIYLIIKLLVVTLLFLGSILASFTRMAWLHYYSLKGGLVPIEFILGAPLLLLIWATVSFAVTVTT